jgi:hypothetical protein
LDNRYIYIYIYIYLKYILMADLNSINMNYKLWTVLKEYLFWWELLHLCIMRIHHFIIGILCHNKVSFSSNNNRNSNQFCTRWRQHRSIRWVAKSFVTHHAMFDIEENIRIHAWIKFTLLLVEIVYVSWSVKKLGLCCGVLIINFINL